MFVTFYLLNGLMAVIGVLHILRKIEPNHFVGIRIGRTLGNERLWYEAHVGVGWSMLITAVVTVTLLGALEVYARYISPGFPVESVGAIMATVLLVVGNAVVPLIYVLRVPEDGGSVGNQTLSDALGSDYAIAVYMLLSVIMMISSLPMALGRVEPNGTYGFRTAKTLSSEAVWYASNEFAGRATVVAGCLTLGGLGLLWFGRRGTRGRNGYACLLMFLVPMIVALAVSVWYVYGYL